MTGNILDILSVLVAGRISAANVPYFISARENKFEVSDADVRIFYHNQ